MTIAILSLLIATLFEGRSAYSFWVTVEVFVISIAGCYLVKLMWEIYNAII